MDDESAERAVPPEADELEGLLRQAVECLREEPIPKGFETTALERLRLLEPMVPPTLRWSRRKLLVCAGLVAAVLPGVSLWALRPSLSWAQVEEALRSQPWIHGVAQSPDGSVQEFWLSPVREVSARRQGGYARYEDHRLRIDYSYDNREKVLYRVPDAWNTAKKEFRSLLETFQALVRGDARLDAPSPFDELVEQKRRVVKDQGKS